MIELGGNITLAGFKEIDKAELVVVKKIIGSYARKLSDFVDGFESITATLKPIHQTAKNLKYELHAKAIVKGKAITSEITDRNLFFALDHVLKKVTELARK